MVLRHALGVMKDGPRAIDCREPCQDGNVAALSGCVDVLRDYLSRASTVVNASNLYSIEGVWPCFTP